MSSLSESIPDLPSYSASSLKDPQKASDENFFSISSHSQSTKTNETKRSHNASFGRVRVLLRCRPLVNGETCQTAERLSLQGDSVILSHPDHVQGKKFCFDRVLGPEAQQPDVFAEVLPMVEHVLNGFHATVFAYGQTGSGKTFTIDGLDYKKTNLMDESAPPVVDPNSPVENHGVLPRVIQVLFDEAAARQSEKTNKQTGEPEEGCCKFEFKCSYIQIYNEKISDLLRMNQNIKSRPSTADRRGDATELRLRWGKGDVFRVQNLFCCECESAEQMRKEFFRGVKAKVIASHLINAQSSRSHSIFTIYVTRRDAKTGDVLSQSEFALVDLAGSEKLSAVSYDPSSRIARESIDINSSLLTLGKVIVALGATKDKRGTHIPYRESNLTKLLKHAIGGNSLTTMIACISPSDMYVDETASTMLYACRARRIENSPKINEDPNLALIRQLREEVAHLKEELHFYRVLAAKNVQEAGRRVASNEGEENGEPVSTTVYKQQAEATGNAQQASVILQEKAALADSLISACEMLNNIIGVNGQLRDAYDTIKADRESGAAREMQLNAENLALRERIEMLESIVLNNEYLMSTEKGEVQDEMNNDDALSESASSDLFVKEPTHPLGVRIIHKSRPSADQSGGRPRSHSESIPKKLQAHAMTADRSTKGYSADSVEDLGHRTVSRQRLGQRPSENIHRDIDGTPQLRTRGKGSAGSARERASSRISSHTSRKARHKKRRLLQRGLEEYNNRYRQPKQVPTYTEYYGKARTPASNQSKASIEEMDSVLQKLPSKLIQEVVPSSLKLSGNFGDLAFVGSKDEVATLSKKRSEREEKLRSLLQKNKELNMLVSSELPPSGYSAPPELQRRPGTYAGKRLQPPEYFSMSATRLGAPRSANGRYRSRGDL